jgi:hypothetical protein
MARVTRMSKPVRVRLSRKRGWRKPANTIVVSRPSRWGNPFAARGPGDRTRVVALYRAFIQRPQNAALRDAARRELRGKNLACWCPLDGPCHADVLLEVAND